MSTPPPADAVPDATPDLPGRTSPGSPGAKLTAPVNREDCKPKKRRSKRHRHRARDEANRANMAAIIARIDAFEAARVEALAKLEIVDACSCCGR
jgi:hypothetical protein